MSLSVARLSLPRPLFTLAARSRASVRQLSAGATAAKQPRRHRAMATAAAADTAEYDFDIFTIGTWPAASAPSAARHPLAAPRLASNDTHLPPGVIQTRNPVLCSDCQPRRWQEPSKPTHWASALSMLEPQ